MKTTLKFIISLIVLVCSSCSSDEPDSWRVRVVMNKSNDLPIRVYGVGETNSSGIVFTNPFDINFTATKKKHTIAIRPQDYSTYIMIKVWVNGRLVVEKNRFGSFEIHDFIP